MAAAARSPLFAVLSRLCTSTSPNPRCRTPLFLPFVASARTFTGESPSTAADVAPHQDGGDLRSRIFRLRFPKRSATSALERWVEEGGKVTAPELRQITRELRRSQRYKHALEICEWMITHQKIDLTDSDYAVRIDLITKVFGVGAAEEFFEGLPPNVKTSETYTSLLHAFAGAKLIEKAENLFEKMKESSLSLSVLTFNEMMTLYISVGQLDKVSLVVQELKNRKVSPDLFTYNLWISAHAANMDILGVRSILDEMRREVNSNEGWKLYMTLTEIYIDAGHLVDLKNSLVETDKKITQGDWITYDFLIILHAGLGNKERINEIWKSLQMTSQKMTSRNYICVLSSHLVLGQLKEASEVVDQWKQSKSSNFDISACCRLYDTLVNADMISIAQNFHQMLLEKNCELKTACQVK